MANPLRRLMESPEKLLADLVKPGMKVLEPGCAMGFFTLPLAKMVGDGGKVFAVDVQPRMLAGLNKRAAKAGLSGRIEARTCPENSLGIDDLAGQIDFCVAIHMVHEVPDASAFFNQAARALKPGGRLLFMEPSGHVNEQEFAQSLALAKAAGLEPDHSMKLGKGLRTLLVKSGSPRGSVSGGASPADLLDTTQMFRLGPILFSGYDGPRSDTAVPMRPWRWALELGW
jgi:SAM-dependent methyltransferase